MKDSSTQTSVLDGFLASTVETEAIGRLTAKDDEEERVACVGVPLPRIGEADLVGNLTST